MAEAFNKFFTTIGPNLECEIPPTNVEPESYLQPTDKVFSLKAPVRYNGLHVIEWHKREKSHGVDQNSL